MNKMNKILNKDIKDLVVRTQKTIYKNKVQSTTIHNTNSRYNFFFKSNSNYNLI
jgi:hypothetical protein